MNPQSDWVSHLAQAVTEFLRARDGLLRLAAHAVEAGWIEVSGDAREVTSRLEPDVFDGANRFLDGATLAEGLAALDAWNGTLSADRLRALRRCASGVPV